MPYERIARYRDDADPYAASPGSTMIDGLDVVDDQAVVLAPLEAVEPTDRRRAPDRTPRQPHRRPRSVRSPRGLG